MAINNKDSCASFSICVVIPAYKVSKHIVQVVESIPSEIDKIIVVDDACPDLSGDVLARENSDPRLEVLNHRTNMGVGGAVKTGYRRALELGYDFIVKIDGDGQMDVSKIKDLTAPLIANHSDYTKGNRFVDAETIRLMPKIRIIGNLILSFMAKISSGQWHIFDPNNGFTAITRDTLVKMPLQKIDDGYFFESDLLFRLYLVNARIKDIPMTAIYGLEESSLKIKRVLYEFPTKHLRNFLKRILYRYYLKDFNLASIELPIGIFLMGFGFLLGLISWIRGLLTQTPTLTGTLVLIAMSVLAGLQLILAFFSYDTQFSKD